MRKKYFSEAERKKAMSLSAKRWREKNPDKWKAIMKAQAERRKKNPVERAKRKKWEKEYYSKPENKKKLLDYMREYSKEYQKKPETKKKNNKRLREARKKNPEKFRALDKKYREKNSADPNKLLKRRETIRKWFAKKRQSSDPYYKIRLSLSASLAQFLKRQGSKKAGSITKLIGCSKEELKKHLEKKFYPHPLTGEKMSWKNHTRNGWHVDHITPMDHFKKEDLTKIETQKKIMHFTNLQPMWSEENQKKSNKILN